MTTTDRRYDIDWLRVIAIGLLIMYHIGFAFLPWGVFIGFIQNEKPLDSLWIPMSMLNVWRIPLLFFVSGMGVCFAIRKRSLTQLILERTRRILVPFLFGIFCIVPLHLFVWQKYYNQDITYAIQPGHLWFLANIFIYVIVLSPLFFFLKKNKEGKINRCLKNLFRSPLGLMLIVSSFVLEALLLKPESYETYSMTLHGFVLGLLAFLFGFIAVQTGDGFWHTVRKWRWLILATAAIIFVVRNIEFQLQAPNYLKAIESNMWIFAAFGFGFKYLNHPSKALSYLSQAAYPVYILHMIFLYLGSSLILPLGIPTLVKLFLIVAFTIAGCFISYEFIIRRVRLLRPLFGLKNFTKQTTTHAKSRFGSKIQLKTMKSFVMKTTILKIAILSLLLVSCEKFNSTSQYIYHAPEYISDGLEVGSINEVNMEIDAIEEAVSKIYKGRYSGVHSMLIYKDDKLVLEEYFPGYDYQWDAPKHHGEWVAWDMTTLHHLMSTTKSVTSACIGLAIDHGFIESVNQSIFDYLPDHQGLNKGDKANITIEHLLTMTSGLEWKEWSAPYSSVDNPCIGIWYQDKDPISYILEKPLVGEPGKNYNYSTGNMVLLGEIIKNATGQTIDDFSYEFLFLPLGIDTSDWALQYENGVDANNLKLTPRAMAKIGATFLNRGVWNGQQIISKQWVEKSAAPYGENQGINIPGEDSGRLGYSYSWWTKEYSDSGKKIHMYAAGGWGGQHIMVLPEVNTVVVFTGGNFVSKRPPFKILEKYVIPSIH